MTDNAVDSPRSLRDPNERARRRTMLSAPNMRRLTRYTEALRRQGRGEVPNFDPLDGGINAQALFLLEKPGPMTADAGRGIRVGSGFISRDNDDDTAEATYWFMRQAAIPREQTILWNVIPWWNGTRQITNPERIAGVSQLLDLVPLLEGLRVIVLVGKKAQRAKLDIDAALQEASLPVPPSIRSAHPSPLVRARWPDRWNAIPEQWMEARQYIDVHDSPGVWA